MRIYIYIYIINMFIENLIRRHKNAYSIGEKIIQNMNHQNNFFNIPHWYTHGIPTIRRC
uniref:Uncharacterized protein n=1 Tax=viral metagenome TaxID=1070528 RepID=A0A6C0BWL8_9ZZZZ